MNPTQDLGTSDKGLRSADLFYNLDLRVKVLNYDNYKTREAKVGCEITLD